MGFVVLVEGGCEFLFPPGTALLVSGGRLPRIGALDAEVFGGLVVFHEFLGQTEGVECLDEIMLFGLRAFTSLIGLCCIGAFERKAVFGDGLVVHLVFDRRVRVVYVQEFGPGARHRQMVPRLLLKSLLEEVDNLFLLLDGLSKQLQVVH